LRATANIDWPRAITEVGLTACYHPRAQRDGSRRRLALPVDPCERARSGLL